MLALGLTEQQLYDAAGNHFDADAVAFRLGGVLGTLGAPCKPAPVYLHPERLLQLYARVRRQVLLQGCPAEQPPIPSDLRAPLLLARSSHTTPLAAEDGRGDL